MRITVVGGTLTQLRLALFRRFNPRLRRRVYLQPQVLQKATSQANLTRESYSGSGADSTRRTALIRKGSGTSLVLPI